MSDGFYDQAPRRTLAGATILQIIPALREEPGARSAVDIAHVLLHAGARAIVAAESGPLVGELTAAGAEWIPMVNATANPFRLRRNAATLRRLIARERIDIVHAHDAGAAWSAHRAVAKTTAWLVTTLPDAPNVKGPLGRYGAALAQGDKIIAPSNYAAAPVIQHCGVRPHQITIVPRMIDTAVYDPPAIAPERITAQLEHWRVARDDQIIMIPGRVAPWNGQILLPDVARILVDEGVRGFVFVLVGETSTQASYASNVFKRAQSLNVDDLLRMTGHCSDMPAAFAAADIVALPAIYPPLLGCTVAQAQALGRPVVTTNVGVLPEHVVTPPRMPEDVRTGWVAKAGDPADFAAALQRALALDATAYRGMSLRARQFAEYMFSPDSVADAVRSVYTSLLAREP